ncbi:pyridoxal kinase, partial [Vibrio parahaemolyticus EKP-021]
RNSWRSRWYRNLE